MPATTPPQQGARHTDERQAGGHRQAVAHVDQQLHRQVAADPVAGLAQCVSREVQIAAHQPDQAVAQVIALEQDVDHEDEHQACGADGCQQGPDQVGGRLHRRPWRRLQLHPGQRRCCTLVV